MIPKSLVWTYHLSTNDSRSYGHITCPPTTVGRMDISPVHQRQSVVWTYHLSTKDSRSYGHITCPPTTIGRKRVYCAAIWCRYGNLSVLDKPLEAGRGITATRRYHKLHHGTSYNVNAMMAVCTNVSIVFSCLFLQTHTYRYICKLSC